MPRVVRSPPTKNDIAESDPSEVMSECDTGNSETEGLRSKTILSKKKRRLENSPKNEFQLFQEEIREMFSLWKAEQDRNQDKYQKKMLLQFKDIKQERLELQHSVEFLSSKLDDLNKLVQSYQDTIKKQQEYSRFLESKVHDLEIASRPASIEIRNIPLKENESLLDLTAVIIKTGQALSMEVEPKELRDVYRLPGKSGAVRPIVVEFTQVSRKNEMVLAARSYNSLRKSDKKLSTEELGLVGKRTPVYISEHLPAFSRQLFYQAREFAKQNNYKFCWTNNGQILLRKDNGSKLIQVKTKQCLDNIDITK